MDLHQEEDSSLEVHTEVAHRHLAGVEEEEEDLVLHLLVCEVRRNLEDSHHRQAT